MSPPNVSIIWSNFSSNIRSVARGDLDLNNLFHLRFRSFNDDARQGALLYQMIWYIVSRNSFNFLS